MRLFDGVDEVVGDVVFGGPADEVGGIVLDVPIAEVLVADGAVEEGEGASGGDLADELGVCVGLGTEVVCDGRLCEDLGAGGA